MVEKKPKNDHTLTITKSQMRQFLGILIVSSFNSRPQERNYWEKDEIVSCPVVSDTVQKAAQEDKILLLSCK